MSGRVRFYPRLAPGTRHSYREGPVYRFTLEEPLIIEIGQHLGYHRFQDDVGIVWLGVYGREIRIAEGYSTDGCSPKRRVGPFWIGTPDFAWTRLPSTLHDALYQFAHLPCFPITRAQADWIFYESMLAEIERLRTPRAWWARQVAGGYRNAVLSAGPAFYHLGTIRHGRTGSCHLHYRTAPTSKEQP